VCNANSVKTATFDTIMFGADACQQQIDLDISNDFKLSGRVSAIRQVVGVQAEGGKQLLHLCLGWAQRQGLGVFL